MTRIWLILIIVGVTRGLIVLNPRRLLRGKVPLTNVGKCEPQNEEGYEEAHMFERENEIPIPEIERKINEDLRFFIQRRLKMKTGVKFHLNPKNKKLFDETGVIRLDQEYRGVPLYGHSLVLTYDKERQKIGYSSIRGRIVVGLREELRSVSPRIFKHELKGLLVYKIENALEAFEAKLQTYLTVQTGKEVQLETTLGKLVNAKTNNVLKVMVTEEKKAMLIYETKFTASYMMNFSSNIQINCTIEACGLVDANTGNIQSLWSCLETERNAPAEVTLNLKGGNEKTGPKVHKTDVYQDVLKATGKKVCMAENEYVRIIDIHNRAQSLNGLAAELLGEQIKKLIESPVYFSCDDSDLGDFENGGYSPISDLLDDATEMFKMFKDWFKMDKKEILAKKLIVLAHGGRFMNAFFTAQLIDDKPLGVFADGDDKQFPVVARDVVAHEIGHGLTDFTSRLEYHKQSGCINEAFSDMTGETLEYYETKKNDWLINAEGFKSSDGFLRDMKHPGRDNNSIPDVRLYEEGMDVHYCSGPFNRAFVLLANYDGWDTRKAYEVFLEANRAYWFEQSDFSSAACDVVAAATDLCYDTEGVRYAFGKVGISLAGTDCAIGVLSEKRYQFKIINEQPLHLVSIVEEGTTLLKVTADFEVGGIRSKYMLCARHESATFDEGQCEKSAEKEWFQINVIAPKPGFYYIALKNIGKQDQNVRIRVNADKEINEDIIMDDKIKSSKKSKPKTDSEMISKELLKKSLECISEWSLTAAGGGK